MFILFQILAGIFAASFIEWTVHKHILHELGKKKVSIFTKISDRNRRIAAYLKSHPLLFGILLVLLNQGVSAALSGDVAIDLPPDFPF